MLCNIKSLTSRCLAGGAIAGPVFLKTSRPEGQSGAKVTDARLFRNGLTIIFFNLSDDKCNIYRKFIYYSSSCIRRRESPAFTFAPAIFSDVKNPYQADTNPLDPRLFA